MTPVAAGTICLRGVDKTYLDGATKRRVLERFDLDVTAGDSVAICGPSGSGKSTLLNLLAGIVPADTGTIEIVGTDGVVMLERLSKAAACRFRRRQIGYVFQFFNLVPTLTVAENVLLPLRLNGLESLWPSSLERLAALGMGDRLEDFPATLSGGERQRVAIARALAHEPPVVLADEPTGNLDVENTSLVADLLFEEVRSLGITLLIATHNPEIAGRASRRIDLS